MKRILFLLLLVPFFAKSQTVKTLSRDGVQSVAQDTLGVYQPERYGAVGNGSTEDSAAFRAMINAIPSTGGTVIFGNNKQYLINRTININKPITFIGTRSFDVYHSIGGLPQIASTIASTTIFNVTTNGCVFKNITMINYQAGTPTAGAGIAFNSNTVNVGSPIEMFTVENCSVYQYFNGIEAKDAYNWKIKDCFIAAVSGYGIWVKGTTVPDAGDSYISGCTFTPSSGAIAAIYQESSGGLKISNCKVNFAGGSIKFLHGYYGAFGAANTSDLLITGCSFENYSRNAIRIEGTNFKNVTITGNQIAPLGNGQSAITTTGINNISIVGNVFTKFPTTGSDTAIKVTTCNGLSTLNTYYGYGSNVVSTSGVTNVVQASDRTLYTSSADSTSGSSVNITHGNNNFYIVAWGQAFATSSWAGTTWLNGVSSRGLAIISGGTRATGGPEWGVLRGGGYDSMATKLYWDKNGVGVSNGYLFSPGAPPTALLDVAGSSASAASLRLRSGTAPTSPNHGDMWTDASHLYVRLNGVTYQLDQQGGGGGTVKQTHTSGSTVTVSNTTTWLIVNPASLLAALTVTLPASPTDGQEVVISFGGTITSGNVVTSLTISPNSGQTLLQPTTPSVVEAAEQITYRYNLTNTTWYRQ